MRIFVLNEESVKTLLAALMLLSIFGLVTYYVLTEPSPRIVASKLIIIGPSEFVPGKEIELVINAVDEEGILDMNRNDTIRISLNPSSHAELGFSDPERVIWSNSLTIILEAGQNKIKFLNREVETVSVYAEWLEGESPLSSGIIELKSGWPGF